MSAFLGPIHIWLFKKIKFQDELTKAIIDGMNTEGTDLLSQINEKYGILEEGELGDIIDEGNIHGWLQDRITLVEKRLAFVVTELIKHKKENIIEINNIVFQFGKSHSIADDVTIREVFEHLENLLLNGMPCDRVNRIIEETDDQLTWEETVDIHKKYWKMIDGKAEYYYDIRKNLVKGILDTSKITFNEIEEHVFQLKK